MDFLELFIVVVVNHAIFEDDLLLWIIIHVQVVIRLVVSLVLLKLVFVLFLNLVQYIFNIENDTSTPCATLALVVAQAFKDEVILCPAGV